MPNSNNQNSLKIQHLTNEYNNIILQYQDTYNNYLNSISKGNQRSNFVAMPDSMFNSASTIGESTSTGVSNCKTICSSNTLCSGATFNSSNHNCLLGKGIGNIINASSDYTSIVPESIQYSYRLKQLNNQLIDINNEILTTINSSYSGYKENIQKQNEKQKYLQQNYVVLKNERENIEELITQYETINQATINSDLIVTQYYSKYIVLLFVIIFLILLLLRYNLPGNQSGGGINNNIYIKFAFLILFFIFIILSYSKF